MNKTNIYCNKCITSGFVGFKRRKMYIKNICDLKPFFMLIKICHSNFLWMNISYINSKVSKLLTDCCTVLTCHKYCAFINDVRLNNIGLRKFTTASLFVELLTPASFVTFIIIQLHCFQKDFLTMSNLERFKRYVSYCTFIIL